MPLAGNDAAYEAVFEQRGVLRVQSLDEMTATLALLSRHPRLGPGEFASVHDSGGLRGMVIDLAHRIGVPFAEMNAQTTAKLADTLAFGMPAVNPVDAWSGFANYREIFGGCLEALAADPATAITVLFADISAEDGVSQGFRDLVLQAAERTGQPVGVALNWSRHRSMQSLVDLTLRGIPIMDGAENALLAVKHAFAYREFRSRAPIAAPPPPAEAVIAKWRERLVSGEPLDEFESGQLLSAFGVPVAPGRIAQSLEDALAAAEGLGYPVVLKTAAAGITHKSDVDGVRPGLVDPAALTEAYADLSERLGARTLVCAMSASGPGVEVALGIVVDDQFGPLVMVAAGGVLVEVLRDRRFLLPPVDTAAALRSIDALQIKPLLDGVRGSLPVDRNSLCQAIANLGVLATELGDLLTEVDVNPIIAGPNGCVAVDALVIPRTAR